MGEIIIDGISTFIILAGTWGYKEDSLKGMLLCFYIDYNTFQNYDKWLS